MNYTDIEAVVSTKAGVALDPILVPTAKVRKASTAGAGNGEGLFTDELGYQIRFNSRLGLIFENTDPVYDAYVRLVTSYSSEGLELEDRDIVIPAGERIFFGPPNNLYKNTNTEDSVVDAATHTDYIFLQFSTDNDNNATTGYMGSGNEYPIAIFPIVVAAA